MTIECFHKIFKEDGDFRGGKRKKEEERGGKRMKEDERGWKRRKEDAANVFVVFSFIKRKRFGLDEIVF